MIVRMAVEVAIIILLLALVAAVAGEVSKRSPGGSRHRALPRKILIQKNPNTERSPDMLRAILIPADEREPLRELTTEGTIVQLINQGIDSNRLIERVSSGPLRELGTIENVPVLVVDEEGRLDHLAPNSRATILYVPTASRLHNFLAGDAIVIGEGMTPDGPDFIGLADHVGVADIEDLITQYVHR